MPSPYRLDLIYESDGIYLRLAVDADLVLDSERRLPRIFEVVRRIMTKGGGKEIAQEDALLFSFDGAKKRAVTRLAENSRSRIDTILRAPLAPKTVDRLLGITSRERLRWYKDGRLPTSGRGTIKRGQQKMEYPLFPISRIADLLKNPEIIEEWRLHVSPGPAQINAHQILMSI